MGRKKSRNNNKPHKIQKNNKEKQPQLQNNNTHLYQESKIELTKIMKQYKDSLIDIDGSYGEGGGQVLRNSFALAAVLGKRINVHSIRAGRKTPGLRPQHLKGLELVRDMTQGQLHGAQVKSSEVVFIPNGFSKLKSENENDLKLNNSKNDPDNNNNNENNENKTFTADTQTAGSCTLLAQISLPVMLYQSGPTTAILKGGTNVSFSPPIDEIQKVFKPNVARFGVDFNIETIQRGFYPRGGGTIRLSVASPVHQIHAAEILQRGAISRIDGIAFVSGKISSRSASNMIHEAETLLTKYIRRASSSSSSSLSFSENVTIDIREEQNASNPNSSFGLTLIAQTDTGCILGSSATSEKRSKDSDIAATAVHKLKENIEHGGCVDEWVQDQLVIFMGLASGYSRIRCGPLTEHTRTSIHFVQIMTGAKFTIQEDKTTFPTTNIIECEGIGFKNRFMGN